MNSKRFKIFFIIVAVIFIIYIISSTYSKFSTTAVGQGELYVAKWHVLIRKDINSEGIDISSDGQHDISTEIQMTPEDNASVKQGKIAPRSKFTGSFLIDPLDTEVKLEYTLTINNFIYEGNAEAPNIEVESVLINGVEVILDNNTYTDVIDVNSDDYNGEPVEVIINGVWTPKERDNAVGIELGNIAIPINIYVEQCSASSSKIVDLFKSGEIKIGDFITYDAGTWTAEEINSIKVGPNNALVNANDSKSAPSTNFQFGGFNVGMSRNDGALEYNNGTNMYAKMYDDGDSTNKVPLSGWRLWDIDENNGNILLVSAANPEDYRHNSITEGAYKTEYILTGNINESWSEKTTAVDNYTIRDWSMYKNPNYDVKTVKILDDRDLTNWYNKYFGTNLSTLQGQSATFRRIYTEPNITYQNLIDNHSYYWLGAANTATALRIVSPLDRYVTSTFNVFGIRILVSISINSKVGEIPVSQRTVTMEGMEYSGGTYGVETIQTYNVWELK